MTKLFFSYEEANAQLGPGVLQRKLGNGDVRGYSEIPYGLHAYSTADGLLNPSKWDIRPPLFRSTPSELPVKYVRISTADLRQLFACGSVSSISFAEGLHFDGTSLVTLTPAMPRGRPFLAQIDLFYRFTFRRSVNPAPWALDEDSPESVVPIRVDLSTLMIRAEDIFGPPISAAPDSQDELVASAPPIFAVIDAVARVYVREMNIEDFLQKYEMRKTALRANLKKISGLNSSQISPLVAVLMPSLEKLRQWKADGELHRLRSRSPAFIALIESAKFTRVSDKIAHLEVYGIPDWMVRRLSSLTTPARTSDIRDSSKLPGE